jgi:signal transduction histidine kinase
VIAPTGAHAPAPGLGGRWHRGFRRSIKARLVALFVLLALATTAVVHFGLQRALQGGWQAYAKPLAADYLDRLTAELGTPPTEERAQALVARLPITLRIDGPLLNYDSNPRVDTKRRRFRDDAANHDFDAAAWGLVRRTADGHRVTFGLVEPSNVWRTRGTGWMTLTVLVVLTALAYWAVRRLLAPLADITRGVEAFGRGDFATPIVVRRPDELGDVATRVNTMAKSLQGRLEAKRLLLLAISHELRSPLTRARLNAELLADSTERSALLEDLAEMRELIADLLESERLAEGHAALLREPTDLAALAKDLVADHFEGVTIGLELDASIGAVPVDRLRLRLALRNLIENALRHGQVSGQAEHDAPAATVFLRREADGSQLALGVRDRGPGVPPERLMHLGEAFYRPDDARTRAGGGVGLGLHLCRLVAQAHGGQLTLANVPAPGHGLEAAIVLPEVRPGASPGA